MTRAAQLWIAALAGPIVWFASMLANFALTDKVCSWGGKGALFVIVVAALVLTGSAGLVAWRFWRQAGSEFPGEIAGSVGYRRTLALAGVLLSASFFVVIIAQAVPNLMLGGCE